MSTDIFLDIDDIDNYDVNLQNITQLNAPNKRTAWLYHDPKNKTYTYTIRYNQIEAHNNIIISLTSKEHDENFLNILLKIFKHSIIGGVTNTQYYKEETVLLDNLIKDHKNNNKEYDIEEIIETLIKIDVSFVEKDTAQVPMLVENFMEAYNNAIKDNYKINQNDNFIISRPYFADFNEEEQQFYAHSLKENERLFKKDNILTVIKLERMIIDKIIDFNKVTNNIEQADVLLKDYDTSELSPYKHANLKTSINHLLPLNNEHFIEYVNNITIEDVDKIAHSPITLYRNDIAIFFAEYYLNKDAMPSLTLAEIMETYANLIKKTYNKLYLEQYESIHSNLFELFRGQEDLTEFERYKIMLTIICDYINNTEKISESLLLFITTFARLDPDIWFDGYKTGPTILYKLYTIIGSEKTLDLISEISDNGHSIKIKQWTKYINNYEDYKNMPVSWWMELV